jgi:DNA adenine methylase
MRYLGGKSKIRKQIATFLESVRKPEQTYFEPFVGGAWVLQEMSGKRIASDINRALICMYEELQKGWVPPDSITEETYQEYKRNQVDTDPLTAFIGIGCSFGGKWFGGYARSGKRNYCSNAKNSLLLQVPKLKGVEFNKLPYTWFEVENKLIYCDPPYENTTGYKDKFDHTEFWDTMRAWSKNNTVVISEYKAPEDFKCVLEIPTKTDLRVSGIKENRIERLFMYNGGAKC